MSARTPKLLFDALESGRIILEWCAERGFSDYETDRLFRRAVEREFEIIGEALNRLAQSDPHSASRIHELPRIVGFRNRIIHGYDTIDDATVWGIAKDHLPKLISEIELLLSAQE
jgi:uncharacterized protein with HEPN domain